MFTISIKTNSQGRKRLPRVQIKSCNILLHKYLFYHTKNHDIAKGCPKYISSVVEVSSCSNRMTFLSDILFFLGLQFFFSFVRIHFFFKSEFRHSSFVTI